MRSFAIGVLVVVGMAGPKLGHAQPPPEPPAQEPPAPEPPAPEPPAPEPSAPEPPAPEPPAPEAPAPEPVPEPEPAPESDTELAELTLEELLEVEVVTASNMREALSRAPGVVIRLSRDDLEARGYRELLDVFDDLPGMDVVRPWGDNYLKVYWRGYRTDVTHPFLLMIDGMVVNSLWSGDASLAAAIPVTEIDHIEIVYGPASAVYGANAFMGVVNVITVTGAASSDDVFRLRITGGTHGFDHLDRRTLDGLVVQRHGAIRLSLAGRVALGWTDEDAAERFEYTRAAYANDRSLWGAYLDFDNLARGTRSPINQYGVDARLKAGRLEVGAFLLTLATGYGLTYATDAAQPYAVWSQYERSLHARYSGLLADGVTSRTHARVRESGIDNRSYFLEGYASGMPPTRVVDLSYWAARNRSVAVAEDVEATVSNEIALVAGARYERKELQGAYDTVYGPTTLPPVDLSEIDLPLPPPDDLRDIERPITDDYGVYAQARLRRERVVTERDAHALHLGIRYDWSSVFGDAHSPTFRVGYVGEQDSERGLFVGKLLYGEGFHEPNPRQLYGGWLGSGSAPDLRPESSRTLELNLSHTTDKLSNLASVYYVQNYDTITLFAGGAANRGRRDVFGVDYHVRALLRPRGLDELSLWAYYSFIWSEELSFDASDNEVRAPIGDLAPHKAWLGGTARRGRWTATLRGRAVATRETVASNPIREIDGYAVLDANVAVREIEGSPVTLALGVDNLFNTAYSHPGIRTADSGETPGTWDGANWLGSAGFYNSRLPQPGTRIMLTVGVDL